MLRMSRWRLDSLILPHLFILTFPSNSSFCAHDLRFPINTAETDQQAYNRGIHQRNRQSFPETFKLTPTPKRKVECKWDTKGVISSDVEQGTYNLIENG